MFGFDAGRCPRRTSRMIHAPCTFSRRRLTARVNPPSRRMSIVHVVLMRRPRKSRAALSWSARPDALSACDPAET